MQSMRHSDAIQRAHDLSSQELWRLMGCLRRALLRAGRAIAGWIRAWRAQRDRRCAFAALLAMDARALHDLGLDRAGVRFAADQSRTNPRPRSLP